MKKGERYVAKTQAGVGIMEVLFAGELCIKIKWQNKIVEWIYREDVKVKNNYVDPKVKLIERLT